MAAGLTAVRREVEEAAVRAGRDPAEVLLVGVSKYASQVAVRRAYDLGLRHFGENRAAELEARAASLSPDVQWHFVGRLQRNKVRRVRPIAWLLHSLDRSDLCDEWAKGPGAPPPVLIQVNVSGEARKAGVAPSEAEGLVARAEAIGLRVTGLMTIPPLDEDPETSRAVFAGLRRLRDAIRGDHPGVVELSMGMSNDYRVAVEEGSTILRVGRAIFGSFRDEG